MAILLLVFIITIAAVYMIGSAIFYQPQLKFNTGQPGGISSVKRYFRPEGSPGFFRAMKLFSDPLARRMPYLRKLKAQTESLMIGVDLTLLVTLKVFIAILFGALGFLFLMKESVFYAVGALFLGFFLPDMVIMNRMRQRKEQIIRHFPETVDLLDMCVSAGADLVSAIKWVIEKSARNYFIDQLGVVLSEIQVGKPRAEALRDMAKRLKIADVSSFVRTIVQAERMGTPVEEAFKNLSDDTRNRRYQNGERYAIKASLKILFPLIFCILPAIMIVVAGPIIIKFTQGELIPATF